MRIAHPCAEQQAQRRREDRIADVAIFPGHRAGLDPAAKARAHAQVRALNQTPRHHGNTVPEVVATVVSRQ